MLPDYGSHSATTTESRGNADDNIRGSITDVNCAAVGLTWFMLGVVVVSDPWYVWKGLIPAGEEMLSMMLDRALRLASSALT